MFFAAIAPVAPAPEALPFPPPQPAIARAHDSRQPDNGRAGGDGRSRIVGDVTARRASAQPSPSRPAAIRCDGQWREHASRRTRLPALAPAARAATSPQDHRRQRAGREQGPWSGWKVEGAQRELGDTFFSRLKFYLHRHRWSRRALDRDRAVIVRGNIRIGKRGALYRSAGLFPIEKRGSALVWSAGRPTAEGISKCEGPQSAPGSESSVGDSPAHSGATGSPRPDPGRS